MKRFHVLSTGILGGIALTFLSKKMFSFSDSINDEHKSSLNIPRSILKRLQNTHFVSNASAPQCEENMIFPSSFTMINPPRPPLPTMSSSLNVMDQAKQLDETLAYGLPSIDNIVVRRPYIASISFEHRTPRWVAEYYRPGEFMDPKRRKKAIAAEFLDEDETSSAPKGEKLDRKNYRFMGDATIPASFRANPTDYQNSGYARGHMAPAAAHSLDEVDLLETFILGANIVPQNGIMNAGDWAKLEAMTRGLSEHFRHVRVITGPAYLPRFHGDGKRYVSYEVIGKNDVAVPTHLFKVVYAEEPISKTAQQSISSVFPGMSNHLKSVHLPESSRGFSVSSVRDSSPQNSVGMVQDVAKSRANAPQVSGGVRVVYIAAFLMPNNEGASGKHLREYLVPLSKIEKHTGLCLTPRSSALSITMATSN